jgi:integrase/recombinase XerD
VGIESLIDQYLACLQAEGKTPHTIRWHRQALKQFAAWIHSGQHPEDPAQWSPSLLRAYIVFNRERRSARGGPLSASALNSLIRSLHAFCTWLHEEEWVERDLFARVTVPKAPRLVKPTLTAAEVQLILATAKEGHRTPRRDEAILLFLLDTGARAQEVCTLHLNAIDWQQRLARLYGKGNKERYVPFSPVTAKAMQRYALRERKGNSDRFFETEEGYPLTRSGLTQICKRLSRQAGIHVTPHKCRHTFSIEYLRGGGSVFALQKMLGHTSLDMTLRYAALVTDDLVSAHRDYSPISRLLTRRPGR